MKLAVQTFRKEGLASVMTRTWRYIIKWPRYLLFALEIRHLDLEKNQDLLQLVDLAFGAYDGLIMPLQVRSEILQLLNILRSRPPKTLLEIGTSNGGTLFLLCRVAASDASIMSIDLPLGAYGGGYPIWKKPLYRSFASRNQEIHLIRADSHDPATREKVAAILQGQEIDLLFIDGDHTYEGAKKDFEMYQPLVKRGGMIVFHDILPHRPGLGCGVDRYWNEIMGSHEHLELIEDRNQRWAGLGLLVKE